MAHNIEAAIDRSIRTAGWGVRETNPSWMNPDYTAMLDRGFGIVALSDPRLVRIVRLRMNTDDGYDWEIVYCYGQLDEANGNKIVNVNLGADSIAKKNGRVDRDHLIELATKARRFAKGIGLLDENGRPNTDVISTIR